MKRMRFTAKGVCFEVVCADHPLEKALGLSMRRTLPGDGMLFRFRCPGGHAMWMMGMRFALDIVWLSGPRIVSIARNVKPPRRWWLSMLFPFTLRRYAPEGAADAVLECAAGFCDAYALSIGDEVRFHG